MFDSSSDIKQRLKDKITFGLEDAGIGRFEYWGHKECQNKPEVVIKSPESLFIEIKVDNHFIIYRDEFNIIRLEGEYQGKDYEIYCHLKSIENQIATYLLEVR